MVSEPAFRPVRVAVALLAIAAVLAPFAGARLVGEDRRHWAEVHDHGVPVTGVVEKYDGLTLVVAYTDPVSGRRATVRSEPDRDIEENAEVTVLVQPGHPHYPVLADPALDPAPTSGGTWGGLAAVTYAASALLLLGWQRHLRETYRTATWQPAKATPWSQSLGVAGTLVRLALYRPDAVSGDRPVRSVAVLWNPALLALGQGQAVEVSGDPDTDAVVVVRHGGDVLWPTTVVPRENAAVARMAPAYGEADPLPRPRRAGRVLAAAGPAFPVFAAAVALGLGTGTFGGLVAVLLGAVPVAFAAGVFVGFTPRLRDGAYGAPTVRFRRLGPGRRAPWYLQVRFVVPLAIAGLVAATVLTVH